VLKDALAVVSPYVDPVWKLGPRGLVVVGGRGGRRPGSVCCGVDRSGDNLELLFRRRG
jgi:hypothetical protein